MLSDEEKKAIEYLNYIKNKTPFILWYEEKPYNRKETINIILDLIEKQSKEIEELKEKNEYLPAWVSKKYISKDKIKAKIEEFKTVRDTILENEKELNRPMMTYDLKRNDYCEKMLQSLLEKE